MNSPPLRLFTFDPAWGLPTCGPFGLKLEACLRLLGVPYEQVNESDNRKGPKRKSPWIEDGGARIGDTELILEHLKRTRGLDVDRALSPSERANGQILSRMLEEHYHQVFEYELLVLDEGFVHLRRLLEAKIPAPMLALGVPFMRRGFKKHLFERGIARHTAEQVTEMGRADLDALSTWLGDREWFVAESPAKADASAFGLLAVSIRSPLTTPVCTYARSKANLVRFVDRGLARFFPEHHAGGAASVAA
ncbi:MAG TPA: glutathione S-transferase family protein [Polyangiaceae bacterium]